jgi:hypothetical protein
MRGRTSDRAVAPVSVPQQIAAVFGSAVALLVVLALANPPDANELLFAGGWHNAVFGVAMVALLPLLVVVQIGLGALFGRVCAVPGRVGDISLLWLAGSAVLSLIGVVLAIGSLIGPWTCGGLFVLLTGYGFASSNVAVVVRERILPWCRLEDVASEKAVFVVVRIGIAAALVMVALRAATGELNDTDVVQFYWGWLNEVHHLGGVHLSPEMPLIQEFSVGRGNGIYLFFAGIAPGLVSHAVSAVFCAMFAVFLRRFVLLSASSSASERLTLLAADTTCLAALWMLPGAVAFGKYHLQFAVWALGFMLVCLQIVVDEPAEAQARRRLLLPLAIAIPVGLAQFEAFVVLIIFCAVLVAPSIRDAAKRLAPLLIVGCVGAVLSLLGNWLYLGIPDLNPFPLFERFIAESRFGIWTSRLQQYDINYIQAGALTFNSGDGVGVLRELRTLLSDFKINIVPLTIAAMALVALTTAAITPALRRSWSHFLLLLLSVLIGVVFYWLWSRVAFSDLALNPAANRLVLYALASAFYLLAIRPFRAFSNRPFVLGLLGYWLICASFLLVFRSGNMERLMRHADAVFVALLLVAAVHVVRSVAAYSAIVQFNGRIWTFRLRKGSAMPLLLALAIPFVLRSAAFAAKADPPRHLLASTLGVQGRADGLTHPMAKFSRCEEIARSVPPTARVLFLNAYTAMAYCNNAVLLPRTMIVTPHESDFARDLATSAFADAETVKRNLRQKHIDYFVVLKGDTEFWSSGLSAPFRPGELERHFDLAAETPSFYVLTWRGAGVRLPAAAIAAITEWRRIAIQQHGFIAHNEFVGQWRAMANLGADRPRYALGTRLDFTSSGWSALYADHGWYAADSGGTWTLGPVALLKLPLAQAVAGPLRVQMDVMPFLIPQIPNRTVRILSGSQEVAVWAFRLGDGYQTRDIDLPAGAASTGEINLTFLIEPSVSQYALSISEDWRPLGFSVRSLTVEPDKITK